MEQDFKYFLHGEDRRLHFPEQKSFIQVNMNH